MSLTVSVISPFLFMKEISLCDISGTSTNQRKLASLQISILWASFGDFQNEDSPENWTQYFTGKSDITLLWPVKYSISQVYYNRSYLLYSYSHDAWSVSNENITRPFSLKQYDALQERFSCIVLIISPFEGALRGCPADSRRLTSSSRLPWTTLITPLWSIVNLAPR